MERKPGNIFVQGPIDMAKITEALQGPSSYVNTGAQSIFLGQIRADELAGGKVRAIVYTAYEDMALEKVSEIREAIFAKYPLTAMHIYHSLGEVRVGEISLFVLVASKHRRAAIEACAEVVELLKHELPVWGKEMFEQSGGAWKVNT